MVSSVTVVEARVGVGVASIGTIGIPGVSLGLGLGLSISRPITELVNERKRIKNCQTRF